MLADVVAILGKLYYTTVCLSMTFVLLIAIINFVGTQDVVFGEVDR